MPASIRNTIKRLIINTPLYPRAHSLRVYYDTKKAERNFLKQHGCSVKQIKEDIVARQLPEAVNREIESWISAGKPIPPPGAYKQQVVKTYAQKYDAKILIETGTFLGEMCYAGRDIFQSIYSIELSRFLHRIARQTMADCPNVTLLQGDSSRILPELLTSISEPCIFWLDAHYSTGFTAGEQSLTPIAKELQAIASHTAKGHIILIDDARDFKGDGYPELEYVMEFCAEHFPEHKFLVEDDVIRVYPQV